MILGRRDDPGLLSRIWGFLWPRAGWQRASRYYLARIARLKATPPQIAMGFACGAAVSFLPLVGFHFLLGAAFALLLRGNVVASAVGTVVGNPWTFPFIWAWTFAFGNWLMGAASGNNHAVHHLSIRLLLHHPWEVLLPMTVGGVPTGVVAGAACYAIIRRLVAAFQERRHRRLAGIGRPLGPRRAVRPPTRELT